MKALLLLMVASPALAQICTYSPQIIAFTIGSPATSGHIPVGTQGSCTWTATSNVPWITIPNFTPAFPFVGSQSVAYQIDQNTTTTVRTGVITVGDANDSKTITFTQIAGDCNYQITPPVTASYPVGGGGGTFQVTAGCNWNVSPNVSWISITSSNNSTLGNGSVSYTAAANTCVVGRSGVISLNTGVQTPPPPTFTITEAGSQANLTLGSASATFGPAATVGRVQVLTGDGCPWSGFSDALWLQITANSGNGNGTGAVTFSLPVNPGPQRVGHITVGTQVFTVTQTGTGPAAPVLSGMINSASGTTGPISPGEIVSLFGTNMGPATGVAFGQSIPLSLAGVQVMFGNSPAPLTYVSAGQINAVVPYGVAGTAQVTVQYQGQTSNSMPATVQTATPAIFSADLSGHGPGAILNSDYRLNSNSTPAPRGSVVMIYATGGGVTTPPSADASLAPSAEPLARLVAPVTVTIGGVNAPVVYAGGAPGLVSGLTQINVMVPSGVAPGPAVPVLVQIGGYQSQAGLTIAVQ